MNIFYRTLLIFLFFIFSCSCFCEILWPIKEKTYLTGNFGEFRKNHIHAGIDISTRNKIGLPVYAGDDGTLHRIKIQFLGYGKAAYLKLNNGNILVYAHLNDFSPKIKAIACAEQKKSLSCEIDVSPKEKLQIKKGEIIGYSGDTGGAAPHVHMELRDKDDQPVNLLTNCFEFKENTKPIITGIAICDFNSAHSESIYLINKIPKEIEINGSEGIAISAHSPNNNNKLSVYSIQLFIDEKLFFETKMDIFNYNNYGDNFTAYNKDIYVSKGNIYYNLFRAYGNKLPFYTQKNDGRLALSPGRHTAKIVVTNSNHQSINTGFTLVSKPKKEILPEKPLDVNIASKDGLCNLKIDKSDLYYSISPTIESVSAKNIGELIVSSKIYDIKPYKDVFKKGCILIKAEKGANLYKYENGKWKFMEDNTIKTFTKYAAFLDTTPPSIKIISKSPKLRAVIEDKGSGIAYNKLSLEIDGKKDIFEFSVNKKELSYTTPISAKEITITAYDKAGNRAVKNIQLK